MDSGDALDEEVGHLAKSLHQLKNMAREIGEESKRTGEVQDQVEAALAQAQMVMGRGVSHMKRAHQNLTSSWGHMIVFVAYIFAIIMFVYFYTKMKGLLSWVF